MNPEQRRQVLVEWNDTGSGHAPELVVELFEAQAGRTPDAAAVEWPGGVGLTYSALDGRADAVAARLQALAVGPETPVAVCVERSVDLVVAILGALKAGAAYVPLDPTYPRERLAYMLADSGARVLLTQSHLAAALPTFEGESVALDLLDAEKPATRPRTVVRPENLAVVIYTSGSTGKPKGVALTHRSVTAFLHWAHGAFSAPETARLLASTSVCFDLSIFELFAPLTRGGAVVLVRNALDLAGLPPAAGITLVNTVPSAMAEILRARALPASVRTVNLAGEALSGVLARRVHEVGTVKRLWNLYGPTEATVYSTGTLVAGDLEGSPTIGRPIANTRTYIVDLRFHPVPPGVTGELYIGGLGLARGYLNRPELTAERFVPDPFGEEGGRLYRTGDLARYRADGEIEFLGRADHQVKIRGFRIEIGEIEEALRAHPTVREAVVVAREDAPGEKRLVAYLAFGEQTARIAELREFLRRTLPEHMIPALVVPLRALPRTLNGKVDRRALPSPGESRPELSATYVAPVDATEERLVALWEEVLQMSPVGVEDDFFELGGHSILAARLFARIARVFHRDLSPTVLFHASTVREVAGLLREKPSESRWSSLVPVQPLGEKPPLFCVHGGAGTILIFQGLSRHLGNDQPLYGLQARGLYGRDAPQTRFEEMAACYLAELREVQPDGPYFLAGFCSGGMIAFEMARRLLAEGQSVALLAGINAVGPGGYEHIHRPAAVALQSKVTRHRQAARRLGGSSRLLYWARAAARSAGSRASRQLRRTAARLFLWAGRPLPETMRDEFFLSLSYESIGAYRPQGVYPGRMIHFRAEAIPSESEYATPQLGWTGYAAGGLEFHVVPGVHARHRTIMDEPAVAVLAAQVATVLETAQAASFPAPETSASARR